MSKAQAALELRRALQLFLATLDADTQAESMMAVSSVFPKFEVGKAYKAKSNDKPADVFAYGANAVGDPQLYMVLQDHTSSEEWIPGKVASLYKAIGITEDGVAVWVQPLGASDAYSAGDRVSHNDAIWVSDCDDNVWEPGVYGWIQE